MSLVMKFRGGHNLKHHGKKEFVKFATLTR